MTIPAAAIHAATETAVRTVAGNSINTGIWTLVAVVVTTIITTAGLIWVAYIKQWGPWQINESTAREADFARLRAEIAEQKAVADARADKLEARVEKADTAAHAAEQHAMRSDAKLQAALTACEVLLALVEREMPAATEIALVKRLLAQAAASDLGVGAGMRKIATMKAVGE